MRRTTEHTEYTEEENLTEYRRFAAYGISRKETVYGNTISGKDEENHGIHGIHGRRKNTEYRFAYGKHGNTKEVGIADPYTDSFREIP